MPVYDNELSEIERVQLTLTDAVTEADKSDNDYVELILYFWQSEVVSMYKRDDKSFKDRIRAGDSGFYVEIRELIRTGTFKKTYHSQQRTLFIPWHLLLFVELVTRQKLGAA